VREIQYCINTPGGFDCKSKKDFSRYNCPAGYKFNNVTLNCEGKSKEALYFAIAGRETWIKQLLNDLNCIYTDVDECEEGLDSCSKSTEECRNTAGAYECDFRCEDGMRYNTLIRICQGMHYLTYLTNCYITMIDVGLN